MSEGLYTCIRSGVGVSWVRCWLDINGIEKLFVSFRFLLYEVYLKLIYTWTSCFKYKKV